MDRTCYYNIASPPSFRRGPGRIRGEICRCSSEAREPWCAGSNPANGLVGWLYSLPSMKLDCHLSTRWMTVERHYTSDIDRLSCAGEGIGGTLDRCEEGRLSNVLAMLRRGKWEVDLIGRIPLEAAWCKH